MITGFILAVMFLILLECLLSFDNALVLAAMVKHLDPKAQKKALTYGIWGAYAFRILALTSLVYVLKYDIVRILGGSYLLWLAFSHFFLDGGGQDEVKSSQFSFWKTVFAVEMADIAFSFDSILAGAGFTQNLLIVTLGGLIGILFMRWAAYVFVRLISLFPRLESTAFLLVSVVGARLIFDCFWTVNGQLEEFAVYSLMTTALFFGLSKRVKKLNA